MGIQFCGRLEHEEVAIPVCASDALVFPSTFPEAFGMVAAEAAAGGTLPVSAAHSGAAEVSRQLAGELPKAVRELISFELGSNAVVSIADCVNGWFGLESGERDAASRALRETVDRIWSWNGVAETVLSAAAGKLEPLPRPSGH